MNCKICQSPSQPLFNTKVLKKYDVQYYKCTSCSFIQTEKPYWLEEAYGSAITKLDVGLIYRNLELSKTLERILLQKHFNPNGKFIDYGGGYGMYVRLMRDKGFDFYRQDNYCENIFAEYFDIDDLQSTEKFELLTSFEVFEHLANPEDEIKTMLTLSDSIFFSTELQPGNSPAQPEDWWYFVPETGQHIAFYTVKALQHLADHFSLNFYTNGVNLHLFTKKTFAENPFITKRLSKIDRIKNRIFPPKNAVVKMNSLMTADFNYIKNLINK